MAEQRYNFNDLINLSPVESDHVCGNNAMNKTCLLLFCHVFWHQVVKAITYVFRWAFYF